MAVTDGTGRGRSPDWARLLVGLRDGAWFGDEEGVRRRGQASLHVKWLARGRLLRLRVDELTFNPTPLSFRATSGRLR
jgi:hypothetical protein